ncbi:alpha-beta hydrolase superfamily lysophospholipase [Stackebrandtia endophytica]|uniref:Alpha-beta hydrolase superfamily lysophospholipase n=1 Tax=Stackebrandtia endophytica TaxID=1496996 RepID=A0A543AVQ7_9ACTN|nr:alpha/beta hydrolase [Stackebrandtia endophytica]TQL76660.1 alpha-beta hydrolase superfamily lysophospholipase [Stackebrandtia endophytica]
MFDSVDSRDGTRIAFHRDGAGPPVVLVGGGLTDHTENAPLAARLAADFTVYNYDRRGRGDSGDTAPYSVQREIEDLAAIVEHAGGHGYAYGVSSGGALLLEAVLAGVEVDRLAVYEVPYSVDRFAQEAWRGYVDELVGLSGADAVELFMRFTGADDAEVVRARDSSSWPRLARLGETLSYDAACLGSTGAPPVDRLARLTNPTLVITGEPREDPHATAVTSDFFARAADEIVAAAPGAGRLVLPGQQHVADPATVGDALTRFFSGGSLPAEEPR